MKGNAEIKNWNNPNREPTDRAFLFFCFFCLLYLFIFSYNPLLPICVFMYRMCVHVWKTIRKHLTAQTIILIERKSNKHELITKLLHVDKVQTSIISRHSSSLNTNYYTAPLWRSVIVPLLLLMF